MVNGEMKSLNTIITFGIAKISPILRDSYEGGSIYRRTLVQIFSTAVNQLYSKEFNIIFHHGVNNGYLIKKSNEKDFSEEEIKRIKEKMDDLIKKDLKIEEIDLSQDEDLNYFKEINHNYSVSLIESNNTEIVKCSCIDKFLTLFFRLLDKSTGNINEFDVRLSSEKIAYYYYFQQIQNQYLKI